MVEHTLKTLRCEHGKIFKVFLAILIMHERVKGTYGKHDCPEADVFTRVLQKMLLKILDIPSPPTLFLNSWDNLIKDHMVVIQ